MIYKLLESAISSGASDLHLSNNHIVKVRINGELCDSKPIENTPTLYSIEEILEQLNLLLGSNAQVKLTDLHLKKSFN